VLVEEFLHGHGDDDFSPAQQFYRLSPCPRRLKQYWFGIAMHNATAICAPEIHLALDNHANGAPAERLECNRDATGCLHRQCGTPGESGQQWQRDSPGVVICVHQTARFQVAG
jgi:hypothetical protein